MASFLGDPRYHPFTRQRNALTSAYRRGIRAARRSGDSKTEIDLLQKAQKQGLQVSGITNHKDREASYESAFTQMGKEAAVNKILADKATKSAIGDEFIPDTRPYSRLEDAPYTPGLDSNPVRTERGSYFTDRDKASRDAAALRGAFGKAAKDKAEADENAQYTRRVDQSIADDYVMDFAKDTLEQSSMINPLDDVDSSDEQEVSRLGGNTDSFLKRALKTVSKDRRSKYVSDLATQAEEDFFSGVKNRDISKEDIPVESPGYAHLLRGVKALGGTEESFINYINRKRRAGKRP